MGIGLKVVKANDMRLPGMSIFGLEFSDGGLQAAYRANNGQFLEIEAGKAISLTDEIKNYLLEFGERSATTIAEQLGRSRAKVSTILKADKQFVFVKHDGASVLYGVASTAEEPSARA